MSRLTWLIVKTVSFAGITSKVQTISIMATLLSK
jgi:hypothetical protein